MNVIRTELARNLRLRKGIEQYDEHCKHLLSYKVILAWIMKAVVPECKELPISEIIDCIEGEPEVSNVKVNPGETNEARIDGRSAEDTVPGEGCVFYDIRFQARIPGIKMEQQTRILLNLEGQKRFRPGYSLVTRGIFYGSRMISAQLGVEFTIPHYDGLKHVYSIWVCTNSPSYIGNAVTRFALRKEDLVPGYPDISSEYDKLTVTLICLNEKCADGSAVTELLNTIFSRHIPVQEKMEKLENVFQIKMENDFREEMGLMCNIGEGLVESTREESLAEGLLLGRAFTARRMLQKKIYSDEQILEITDISPEHLEQLKLELTK